VPAKGKAKVAQASARSLERALAEERLALAAITKVFLLETPDPSRLLARLEAMCRAAEQDRRTPAKLRRSLLTAVLLVRTAIQRELGKPQSLLEPDVGHTAPAKVDALVAPTDGAQQLGLGAQDSLLGDVEEAQAERVQTISTVHAEIVRLLREDGAATDSELHARYAHTRMGVALPLQSPTAIRERRQELCAAGRVVRAGQREGAPAWDIVEREALTA